MILAGSIDGSNLDGPVPSSFPTAIAAPYDAVVLTSRDPGLTWWERLEDRYLTGAVLIIASIIMYAAAGDHRLGQIAVVVVQSLALVVILHASRVSRRLLVVASVLIVVAIAATAVSVTLDRQSIGPAISGCLLAFVGPVVIVRRIMTHARIDLATVAASLCIYLLAGLFFAWLFRILDIVNGPFFAQRTRGGAADFVYFSFVTLTTLGYGDLTSRLSLGRMIAVSEALLGQLYLVSVVALLVANLGRTRGTSTATETEDAP